MKWQTQIQQLNSVTQMQQRNAIRLSIKSLQSNNNNGRNAQTLNCKNDK